MEYFLSSNGERSGPHSQFHLIGEIRDGRLKGDELAWRRGMDTWKTLGEFEELGEDGRSEGAAGFKFLAVVGHFKHIHVFSVGYMHGEEGFTRFFTYMNLFMVSMLLLAMGNNYVVLFIGWEGVGLCSYLLIGYYYDKVSAAKAATKAFVVNRIGDAGFLLAIFLVFYNFGTLDYKIGRAHV